MSGPSATQATGLSPTRHHYSPLPRHFFARSTAEVARDLLGHLVVRVIDGQVLSGLIVETEAYGGQEDLASHAARGRRGRAEIMYGPPGLAYVYIIYGMHYCLNVVTETDGRPGAVLIRAIEPLDGTQVMHKRRGCHYVRDVANGPGKLCQALAIDGRLNGTDLAGGSQLYLAYGRSIPPEAVHTTARIGVRGDDLALRRPWRFLAQAG
jgi:DNA-3-methyladenine glycosylase